MREKKPPERLCPRGAKDTDFSGSDWTLPRRARFMRHFKGSGRRQAIFIVLEASRPLPCRRLFASWSAGTNRRRGFPDADPPAWIVCSPMHDSLWPGPHPCGRHSDQVTRKIGFFPFLVKGDFQERQGIENSRGRKLERMASIAVFEARQAETKPSENLRFWPASTASCPAAQPAPRWRDRSSPAAFAPPPVSGQRQTGIPWGCERAGHRRG